MQEDYLRLVRACSHLHCIDRAIIVFWMRLLIILRVLIIFSREWFVTLLFVDIEN